VNRLLRDPELARRFGEAGRRRAVESFNWKQIAAQTVSIYEELLSRA
jgi:starch synthase